MTKGKKKQMNKRHLKKCVDFFDASISPQMLLFWKARETQTVWALCILVFKYLLLPYYASTCKEYFIFLLLMNANTKHCLQEKYESRTEPAHNISIAFFFFKATRRAYEKWSYVYQMYIQHFYFSKTFWSDNYSSHTIKMCIKNELCSSLLLKSFCKMMGVMCYANPRFGTERDQILMEADGGSDQPVGKMTKN